LYRDTWRTLTSSLTPPRGPRKRCEEGHQTGRWRAAGQGSLMRPLASPGNNIKDGDKA
jgi:hypothetical protein